LLFRTAIDRAGRIAAGACIVLAACLVAACSPSLLGGGPRPGPTTAPVTGEVLGTGPVKVGFLLPLSATGNTGQIAQNMKNAADLAIREFPSSGIQLLVKDDRGTADGARAAATAAISEGAELILGPVSAQSVTAAAAVARPAHVPIIAFSTDSSVAARGVYLLSFLPQSSVDRIVRYASSQGKRSYAGLVSNDAFGALAEAALQKAAANAGGRVMALERYDLDRVSMQAKATAVAGVIQGGAVDAVLMPGGANEAPFLAQILAANKVKPGAVKYLGSGQWDDSRVAAESNLAGAWYPAPERAGFAAFAARYQTAFGAAPLRPASLAYDATSLAAGLAARFGTQRFADKTITNPSGFIGIDGAFRFLANGLNERGLAVYQISHGRAAVVEAAPRNFSKQ
jgi:ABC-type branched-subunit amino acid transport system substrate-binding protein